MDDEPRDRTQPASGRVRPPYPLHKLVAAIPRDMTEGVVTALVDADFAREQIEVVTAKNVFNIFHAVHVVLAICR